MLSFRNQGDIFSKLYYRKRGYLIWHLSGLKYVNDMALQLIQINKE